MIKFPVFPNINFLIVWYFKLYPSFIFHIQIVRFHLNFKLLSLVAVANWFFVTLMQQTLAKLYKKGISICDKKESLYLPNIANTIL